MAGHFVIRKYTGKCDDFGNIVSSVGIKRIDSCVPAVYTAASLGGKVIPADDASESRLYCIYAPEDPDCKKYSMESVIKLHLDKAPDVQISNVRIYPVGERPESPNAAKLYIGNSVSYSQPTDAKSQVAVNDIWDYSKDHPFYLTVAGTYGQVADPQLGKHSYNVEFKDCGYGNVIYLDGVRQLLVPVATRTDNTEDVTVRFVNRTFMAKNFPEYRFIDFIDPATGMPIDQKYAKFEQTTDGPVITLRVKTADGDLMEMYPDGLIYKIPAEAGDLHEDTGYTVVWARMHGQKPGSSPVFIDNGWLEPGVSDDGSWLPPEQAAVMPWDEDKPVEYLEVSAQADPKGRIVYYVNGQRRPMLNLDIQKNYHIVNLDGDRYPLRVIGHGGSPMANNTDDVIVDGVIVMHGCTADEEIFINPERVLKAGKCIRGYQCTCEPSMGNMVFNVPMSLCGNYNICRVGGGIYNPMLAGETDFVYMQLEVTGRTDPGTGVPDIIIEYDEN